MTIAKRLECPWILSVGVGTLLLAAGLPAQSRYLGELEGKHSVTRVYTRAGSCTIATRVTPVRQTTTFEPGEFDIFPPSGFSCQPHRFRDGHAVVNHPDVPVIVELSDPTEAPTVVNLSEPSNITAKITLMGRAEFRESGDDHAVRIGVEAGLDPGARIARNQTTCSRQDAFVTEEEASRLITADVSCAVSVMDVVEGSVEMGDVDGVMMVTEFAAEVESEFYIVMDHGSPNAGSSIRRGARLTYTVKSRYKFRAEADFKIDHIEVVQVVQDEENTVQPLVTGKSFVIRIFPKLANPGPEISGVPVRVELITDAGEAELELDGRDTVVVESPSRGERKHSYNIFLGPRTAARTVGDLTIKAVINPDRTIEEPDFDNNSFETTVTFNEHPGLRIKYLPICIQLPGEPESCPEDSLGNLGVLTKRMFPVADAKFEYSDLEIDTLIWNESLKTLGVGEQALLQHLERIYFDEAAERGGQVKFDQLIGILPEKTMGLSNLGGFAGVALPLWKAGQGRVSLVVDQTETDFIGPVGTSLTVAHEIGHNLGLRHPNTEKCKSFLSSRLGDTTKSLWPFPEANIQEHGADVLANEIIIGKPAGHPDVHYDLMESGCGPQWISEFHYVWLFTTEFEPTAAQPALDTFGAPLSLGRIRAEPGDFAFVSGRVSRDGLLGKLNALQRFTGTADPNVAESGGEYCPRFTDGTGAMLAEHCFPLTFRGGEGGQELDEQYFSRLVSLPASTASVSLHRLGAQLDSITASASAPTVEIQSPSSGERWEGSPEQVIRWTGNDADGDRLRYSVFYSPSGNTDWRSLAIDLEATEYGFDPSTIRGGSDVWFRVKASDGFHRGEADVGPVAVVQRPQIAVDDKPVDLGEVVVGQSIVGSVTLRNTGSGPLEVTAITSDSELFEVLTADFPLSVRAGSNRNVLVRYTASVEGLEVGSLDIRSNASDQPETLLAIQGSGTDGQTPRIRLENESIGFPVVATGATRTLVFTIGNVSLVDLEVEWEFAGADVFSARADAAAFTLGGGEDGFVAISFAPREAGEFQAALTLRSNDPDRPEIVVPVSGRALEAPVLPPPGTDTTPGAPRVNAGGVVDAASFQAVVARGSIGSLFGVNLADGVQIAADVPLPLALGGAAVQVDGHNAPLFFVSPTQINFQVPFEVRTNATVEAVVIRDEVESPPVTVPVADYAPGVFLNPNTGEPIIQRHPDGALITAANPAQPGDVLIAFVTGIGDVSNPPPTGAPALGSPLATANLTPTVTVGDAQSQVFFAGLAPFFVGLGQVNIQLPSQFAQTAALRTGAAQGATLPLVIAFGESRSQAVNLPIAGVTVQPGRIDVGPVGLDFGDVNVGQSGNGTLTVRNVGAGSLTVNSINTDNARFAVVSPPTPFTVPPGAQRMITLSFQPTAVGRVDASALIGSDDPLNPAVTIPLLGHGVGGSVAGSLSLSTASLAFGSVSLGQSADLPLTLGNTGDADLTVNTIMSSDPQFSTVFAGSPSATPFTLAAGAELTISVRFQPSSAGMHNATLSVSRNDTASPTVNISLTGEGAGGGGGAPSITLNSNSVSYGGVSVGRTNELTLIVTNGGGGPLTVESITSSDQQFRAAAPETPFIVPVGGQQSVKIHFTPSSLGSHSGTLTFASNDPAQPAVEVALSGNGVAGPHIQFSDSFDRPDASCSPAPADNAFGGGGRHGYLPLFTTRGRPTGARLVAGALENPGMNYAGVQFSDDEQFCLGGEGENIGQDANIRVDLLVPGDSDGNITQAGPYFRTKSATPGSSILGGMSAGYWVQLHSTGQIKLKLLNPEATVAATRTPAAFDNTVMHRLEVSLRRDRLWVALDGVLQVFDQDETRVISVLIPAVWERPPTVGENEGAAGIAFGAEDNPNQIGGQRADNLVVTDYESLTELPVQE